MRSVPEPLDSYFDWSGHEVVDSSSEPVGKLDRIFLDRETDRPVWALISAGLLGGGPMLAPLEGARVEGERVLLAFDKQAVWDSPSPSDGTKPRADLETELRSWYGLGEPARAAAAPEPRTQALDASVPEGVDSATVIRSEEEVDIVVDKHVTERVRLVKRIVTEDVTRVIPLRREEVQLVREPVPAGEPLAPGVEPFEEVVPTELLLMEEQVVIEKRVVPRERVRVYKQTFSEDRDVSTEVRKERVEVIEERAPRRD